MTAARRRTWTALLVTASCGVTMTSAAWAQARESVTIRGQDQSLHVYGTRGGMPVIVSSGDGGWMHLAPHVAEVLAAKGFFVVGFDVKAYLERFTAGRTTLRPEDEPGDYKVLADFAARGASQKPILIGVSEGRGVVRACGDRSAHEDGDRGSDRPGIVRAQRAGMAMEGRDHLPDARRTERAVLQRLDDCRPYRRRFRWARFTPRTTSSCRSRRSSACWRVQMSRRSSGLSTRSIIASATNWRSSTGAYSKPITWMTRPSPR